MAFGVETGLETTIRPFGGAKATESLCSAVASSIVWGNVSAGVSMTNIAITKSFNMPKIRRTPFKQQRGKVISFCSKIVNKIRDKKNKILSFFKRR